LTCKVGYIDFKNGNHYDGELQYGNMHGQGKLTFKDGVVYEGQFEYNVISGEVIAFEFSVDLNVLNFRSC